MRVVKSDKANRDLLQIYAYLADRNVDAAEAVIINHYKSRHSIRASRGVSLSRSRAFAAW